MAVNAVDWDFPMREADDEVQIIPAGYNPNNAVVRQDQPQPAPDEDEEENDTKIFIDQVIDPDKGELYKCVVCWHIAERPHIHSYTNCQTLLCYVCFQDIMDLGSYEQKRKCPRKCASNQFMYQCVPLTNISDVYYKRTIEERNLLMVKCKNTERGCTDIIEVQNYKNHVLNLCSYHRDYCQLCEKVIKNHTCPLELLSLKAQINDLTLQLDTYKNDDEMVKNLNHYKFQNQKLQSQLDEVLAQNDRLHLRCLELKQQSSLPNSQENPSTSSHPTSTINSGLSNHIRTTKDYRKEKTQFIVKFGDRTVNVHNLSLDAMGKDLRAQVEQSLGCPVGDIVNLIHVPIRDDKRLLRHQLSTKPTHLIALPPNRWIKLGSTLNVTIGSNGPII